MENVKWYQDKYGTAWYKIWMSEKKIMTNKGSYYSAVGKLTEKVVDNIPGYDKSIRGFNSGYQVDHKISVSYGFKNGIDPKHISDLSNLQFISKEDNNTKNSKNLIDKNNEWILRFI